MRLFFEKTTKQRKIVLDLFSGVGVFGLTVAHKIPNISKVIGYEIVKEAVLDANENAIMNNLSNTCEFYVRDLTKTGPLEGIDVDDTNNSNDEGDADCIVEAVILDPARPGCSKTSSPKYESYDQNESYTFRVTRTQARTRAFCSNEDETGGPSSLPTYSLASVKPCDMFPHALRRNRRRV